MTLGLNITYFTLQRSSTRLYRNYGAIPMEERDLRRLAGGEIKMKQTFEVKNYISKSLIFKMSLW